MSIEKNELELFQQDTSNMRWTGWVVIHSAAVLCIITIDMHVYTYVLLCVYTWASAMSQDSLASSIA